MTQEHQNNNGLPNFSTDKQIQQHIRMIRKSAEEAMSFIDDHKLEAALQIYHKIHRQLQQESNALSVVKLADLSPLGKEYIKEIPMLAVSLPEKITETDLYTLLNNIYKTFHKLSKID